MTDEKKKKGVLAAIWECITKIGCCGSNEDSCSPPQPEKKTESGYQDKDDKKDGPCCTS